MMRNSNKPLDEVSKSLQAEKKDARKIARDLRYPKPVFEKIESAKTGVELDRIMRSAREGKF